ncbi:ACP phosphodiesterase [Fulvivirga ulvae]|uniref:acyl carrier protein phosphodiesterase n=1 Tax=Fulvivirga ulvae TaxID=2904245 RepID=UPI001F18AB7C|nr:ACP phosphodiesterase [Fulvivirga ulvae]UII29791.1 ACP phosphodiesterase [Fulvivirga ulvae]
MNFLAHLYLSGNDEEIMVGNFIGDFVKGKAYEVYSINIQRGIMLHRHIDEYTDHHEIVSNSKKRLWNKYRHYAGVIVDMFYDHFLAANWSAFHQTPLADYAQYVYKLMLSHESRLPKGVRYMLPFMIDHNWLLSYANKDGIHNALSGMARRTTFTSRMDEAIADLDNHYDEFESEFQAFFPDLRAFVGEWLKNN